jgi:polysaccharide pyruvyl transferase WcaK-like protein
MLKKIICRIFLFIKTKQINHNKIPSLIKIRATSVKTFFHSSAYSFGNSGDLLLPVVLRDLFNISLNGINWKGNHVHTSINSKSLSRINSCDALVIGGGGLFLSDTNPNSLSGWQWSCSIEHLKKINTPIILFAVGYNRFRDQEEFNDVFKKHIALTVEKAAFIGIRNHGSINNLKNYLPHELHNKLVFQPCMTTLISRIYPNLFDFNNKQDFISINCAFDRSSLRLGNKSDSIKKAIANVVKKLSEKYAIRYYSHMETDKQILKEFDELGINYRVINLQYKSASEIIRLYSSPKLAIGMRGHAQMIPFGCQTPIVSIVSHNKMQWFLNDINHPEWGSDVLSDNFENELFDAAKSSLENTNNRINDIIKQQTVLWNITNENMDKIKKITNSNH